LEGIFNYGRVVDDSLVGEVLEGASPAGGITPRLSGVGWSLEDTSPNGRHTTVDDGACWFLERLSMAGDSTGAVATITAFNYKVFNYTLVLREAMI